MGGVVLLTGISGFIAQHICTLLLEDGYTVIGTVRSAEKQAQMADLFNQQLKLVIVEDISKANAFDEVFTSYNLDYIIHTAAPFFYDTSNPEQDLILPTINGIDGLLKSISNSNLPNLKKLVITSSDAAMYSEIDELNPSLTLSEASWNIPSYQEAITDAGLAYYYAKSIAEKHFWDFHKSVNPSYSITAINPAWVFGPQVHNVSTKLNTSNETINQLLDSKEFDIMRGGYIDVRDVAKAHVQSLTNTHTNGKRLYMINDRFSTQMILDIIHMNIPEISVPIGKPGSGSTDIANMSKFDNSATRDFLNFDFIPLEQTITDVVKQIVNHREITKDTRNQ